MTLQIAEFTKGNKKVVVYWEKGGGYKVETRETDLGVFSRTLKQQTYGTRDAALSAAIRKFKKI